MLYNWILPNNKPTNNNKEFKSLEIPSVIKKILQNRNIAANYDITHFLNPDVTALHDPFLMNDMDIAVSRLLKALKNGEHILIYGDYDVDGVTSVSILYEAIYTLGGKASFYIPDRNKEGYGLTNKGVDEAIKRKASLIVTVDCGVTAYNSIENARINGIDTIVCDHHELLEKIPPAIAILNPKVTKCNYPFKELAGCGVVFKLLQGLTSKLGLEDAFAHQFLDLVALGTAADIVELTGENRTLVYFGLQAIKKGYRPGIAELISICGFKKGDISVRSIVFSIAPRINAAGRISMAKKAVHLLISKSTQQAKNIAQILNSENKIRRKIDENTLRECERLIAEQVDLEKDRIIVLAGTGWHLGVIGIVASRIVEKYHKPTILFSISGKIGTASARSTDQFNMISSFKELKNILLSFGGHKRAAGLKIEEKNINLFREKINYIAKNSVKLEIEKPRLNIDSDILLNQYNAELFKWLNKLEPYGPGNMRPVFLTRNLNVSGPIRKVGERHLKFKVSQNGFVVDAIAYNMKPYHSMIKENENSINLAYVLEENNWHGQTTVQLSVKDFEVNNA